MAEQEINKSKPYFMLLSEKNLDKSLRLILIKKTPPEFFNVLTQTVRHLLNNSVCALEKDF